MYIDTWKFKIIKITYLALVLKYNQLHIPKLGLPFILVLTVCSGALILSQLMEAE